MLPFTECPALGRFAIVDNNIVHAVGVVSGLGVSHHRSVFVSSLALTRISPPWPHVDSLHRRTSPLRCPCQSRTSHPLCPPTLHCVPPQPGLALGCQLVLVRVRAPVPGLVLVHHASCVARLR